MNWEARWSEGCSTWIKVTSFFTSGQYYREALKLSRSLIAHGVWHEIRHVDLATWQQAVLHKPAFILENLERLAGADGLLWTDADSQALRAPPWEDLRGCDVGAVKFKRGPAWAEEILTGTLYFARNEAALQLLREWVEATPKNAGRDTPEQESLKEVLARPRSLAVKWLPPEWCWIKDDCEAIYGPKEAIFSHSQASRRLRFAQPEPVPSIVPEGAWSSQDFVLGNVVPGEPVRDTGFIPYRRGKR